MWRSPLTVPGRLLSIRSRPVRALLLRPLYSHLRLVSFSDDDLVADDLYLLRGITATEETATLTVGALQDDDDEGTEFVPLRLISEVDKFGVPDNGTYLVVAVRDRAASAVDLRARTPSPTGIEHLTSTNSLEAVLTIDPPLTRKLDEFYTIVDIDNSESQKLPTDTTRTVELSYTNGLCYD